jgi:hypothetical protein
MSGPNSYIQGTYSMPSQGMELTQLTLTAAFLPAFFPTWVGDHMKGTPLAALSVVSYDGKTDANHAGGVSGYGVLKLADATPLTSGTPEPLQPKIFRILPISRYWISAYSDETTGADIALTGKAIFVIQFAGPKMAVVHYYFVLEDVNYDPTVKDYRANGIQFIMTDAKVYDSADALLNKPAPDSSQAAESGRQSRLSSNVLPPGVLSAQDEQIAECLQIPL